jgi:asparagine synthase (glutamine-hydrolysing)
VRAAVGLPLSRLPSSLWRLLPGERQPHFGAKVQKGLRVAASARSFDDVYSSFLDEWSFEASPVSGVAGSVAGLDADFAAGAPDALRMMYCDAVTYLPDDILCKVDRAAMAVSLETRVPFLDHRVAEVAAAIPMGMKVRGGRGKHILRELLYREAPRELFERPKAGFAVPIGEWLKGPLRPWAESLLEPGAMAADGFFDPAVVGRRWRDHVSGRKESTAAIWAVLMFQAWLRQEPVSRREAA